MIKKFFDILLSIILLVITSPVLLLSAILIRIKISKNIFFIQKRAGYLGQPFYLIKFKTMNDKRDKNGNLLNDSERLCKFGKFLRSTSIDELPSLINIIKGEMSFIGPRPLLMEYLKYYNINELKRHEVKPGLSGWAQVNGRNSISWEKKFKFDVWYVENKSILLDLKIIFMTVLKVIKQKGINQNDGKPMPKFKR